MEQQRCVVAKEFARAMGSVVMNCAIVIQAGLLLTVHNVSLLYSFHHQTWLQTGCLKYENRKAHAHARKREKNYEFRVQKERSNLFFLC
jgi:hypothetical protein